MRAMGKVKGFQETVPRNTVRHRDGGSVVTNHRGHRGCTWRKKHFPQKLTTQDGRRFPRSNN